MCRLALGALLLFSEIARADWINLTGAETAPNIAEIDILDDRVRLVLEVYIGDLETFEALVPDDWLTEQAAMRPELDARMQAFAQRGIQVKTDAGEILPARLELVEPRLRVDRESPYAGMINPMTRQRVPQAPADKRVLYAEVSYPFTQRPRALTFTPPLDEEGRPRVSIGFIAYHKSVPVIDFRYLGAAARLELDWDDPWYSVFDNPNLKRHHKDALMSYLYVEPYEVRHEILVRVKDVAQWMDLGLRGEEWIELDELARLKQRIGEHLLARNPIHIDDQVCAPILDRTDYVRVALTGITLIEAPERLEVSTAIVGVIMTCLVHGLPQEVTVDWELFTNRMQRVPGTATDPAGPLMTYLTPDEPVHRWQNFIKHPVDVTVRTVQVSGSLGELVIPFGSVLALVLLLPVLAMGLIRRRHGGPLKLPWALAVILLVAAVALYPRFPVVLDRPAAIAGDLDDERAAALLQALLRNVYRAFDFRAEEDVYDKLALTVAGDLLAELYLQNRQSFAIRKAGGAQARIKEVDILEAQAARAKGGALMYAIRARWTAMGSVGHWGHTHRRKNLYDAIVTVEAVDGVWKITGLDVREESRVDQGVTPEVQGKSG